MLVTFFCDAYENITLFGEVAKKLLVFMQQSGTVPGAILAKDVSSALSSLKQEIAREKELYVEDNNYDDDPEISIEKRAIPIIKLLEHAEKAHCNVMWRQE